MSVGKKSLVGKKIGWKIPGNVRTLPGMQDRKTAEAEKTPLGPRGEKNNFVGWEFFFVGWGKKVFGGKKCQRSETVVYWSKWSPTPVVNGPDRARLNGNIRHFLAGGSGFESRRDEYLNRRNKTQYMSPNEPK